MSRRPERTRDDFSPKVIKLLRERVNNICSNPRCESATIGPHSEPDRIINTGVAAHICAASLRGPRYDASMTPAERASQDNGIWLCATCAGLVDRDTIFYTAEKLRKWKDEALRSAAEGQNRRVYRDEDVQSALAAGLSAYAKKPIPNAITNMHGAVAQSLEQIDPRFAVSTTYRDGATTVELRAKSAPVPFRLRVPVYRAPGDQGDMRALQEFGEDVDIKASGVTFSGSDLFDELMRHQEDARLQAQSHKTAGTIKTFLLEKDGMVEERFEQFSAKIAHGTKGLSIQAESCDRLIELSFRYPLDAIGTPMNITVAVNTDRWQDKDVRFLPFFKAVRTFASRLAAGSRLRLILEVQGEELFAATCNGFDQGEYLRVLNVHLRYIEAAADLFRFLGQSVRFKPAIPLTMDEMRTMIELQDIVKNPEWRPSSILVEDIVVQVEPTGDRASFEQMFRSPGNYRLAGSESATFSAFGQSFPVAPRQFDIRNAKPVLPLGWQSQWGKGALHLVFARESGFEFRTSFQELEGAAIDRSEDTG